jgi:glycosyltransferase involved in cell wall biosynthesis
MSTSLLQPDLLPREQGRSHQALGPRVLIVARWPVGGIRMHLGYNVPALAEAGYRCTFLAPEDGLAGLRDTLAGIENCQFTAVPPGTSLWRAVRQQLRSTTFGLVHAHGVTAAAHACLGSTGLGVPVAATLHEPLRQAQFAGLRGQVKRWLLGRIMARAAAMVAVSPDSRANLLRFLPNLRRNDERIHTIPNGIDTQRYQDVPRIGPLRDELGIADDTTLIGYLGRFMPEKGFPLLIEAVDRLAKHGGVKPFHVVAFGSHDYRVEYQRTIERKGLASYFTLRDFVSDVTSVLGQLDLVVMPSLWEASSLLVLEVLSAGVPLLGSNCTGLYGVLTNTPSRMFEAGVAAELEVGLREALAQPWTEAAREFAATARERFDNRHSARKLVELYDRLTS